MTDDRACDGRTLYVTDDEGGIRFESDRRVGDVRIPNYVYDLWLPILGLDGLGVYALYCRLERSETVKGLSLGQIARYCRIGKTTLVAIHAMLESYGFLTIQRPEGMDRFNHRQLVIRVHEAPDEVPAEVISAHFPDQSYQPLVRWLIRPPGSDPGLSAVLNRTTGGTAGDRDSVPESLNQYRESIAALEGIAHARPREDDRERNGNAPAPDREFPRRPLPRPWAEEIRRYLGGEPLGGQFREAMDIAEEFAAMPRRDLAAAVDRARAVCAGRGMKNPRGFTWLVNELRDQRGGEEIDPDPGPYLSYVTAADLSDEALLREQNQLREIYRQDDLRRQKREQDELRKRRG